jgi:hypothetical protein
VVQAPDAANAVDRLRAMLHRVKADDEGPLANVRRIYLDSCTQMVSVPQGGLVTYLRFNDPTGGSMDVANVNAGNDDAVGAFSPPDSDELEPFIEFVD